MKPINAADILKDAFRLYTKHTATIVGAALVIQLTAIVMTFLFLNVFGLLGTAAIPLFSTIASQLSLGVMTLFLVALKLRGTAPSMADLMRSAGRRTGGLLLAAFMINLAVGLVLCIAMIPALIIGGGVFLIGPFIVAFVLYMRWSVTTPALIVRDISASQAMKESRELTTGHLDSVFVLVLFHGFVSFVIPYASGHVTAMPPVEVQLIAQAVLTALLGPLAWLAMAELYSRLSGYEQPIAAAAPAGVGGAPSGPWVPGVPRPAAPAPAAGFAGGPAFAGAPMQAAVATGPSGYGAPSAYGAPAHPAVPTAYGAPAPYGAPVQPATAPQYGAPAAPPAPYGAPAQPATAPQYGAPAAPPAPHQAPHAAPGPYGAATTPATPAPYGAPVMPPPQAAQPYAQPGMPQAAPPVPPQPALQHHATQVQPTAAYPATGGPYGPPAPVAAPMAPPRAVPPAPPGMPGVPAGGPGGQVHPGRDASVAPPGFG